MENNFNSLGFNYQWGWTLLPIGYTVTWHLKWAKGVTNPSGLIRILFWEFITPIEKFYLPCAPEMKFFTGNFFAWTSLDITLLILARYTFGHSHQWRAWFHYLLQFPPQLHLLNLELHLFNFVMPLEISPKLMRKMLQRNPKLGFALKTIYISQNSFSKTFLRFLCFFPPVVNSDRLRTDQGRSRTTMG